MWAAFCLPGPGFEPRPINSQLGVLTIITRKERKENLRGGKAKNRKEEGGRLNNNRKKRGKKENENGEGNGIKKK